ncbi:MAG TPA: PEP-CTERM sorting domain-containing protein [Tepidisphaeraceae bacterium]
MSLVRAAAVGLGLSAGAAQASLTIQVELPDGSSNATVSAAGQQVQMHVYGIVTGTNTTGADDGVQAVSGSFLSTGNLQGSLVGGLTAPFNGVTSKVGAAADLDNDGDCDWGSNNNTSSTGFWLARSNQAQSPNGYSDPTVAPSTYGSVSGASYRVQLGTLTFTAGSSQAQSTQVNFVPRASSTAAQWFEEVFSPSKDPSTGTFAASAAPVTISLAPEWAADADGTWSAGQKWSADVPAGVGVGAQFLSAIQADRTVTVDSERTVGSLTFDNTHRYTLNGSGPIKMNVSAGNAAITVRSGSHTIVTPIVLEKTTQVKVSNASSRLTLAGDMSASAGAGLIKTGAGTLEVKQVRAASLTVAQGAVEVAANGAITGQTVVNTLSIAAGAKLDLKDNDLVVNNGNFLAISDLRWQGYRDFEDSTATGIVSSVGQTLVGHPILAVFDNTQLQTGDWPFGAGNSVGANAVLGQFAYLGDADLNGMVTPDDYGAVDSNLGLHVGTAEVSGGMNWFAGDWNFDGDITPDDYSAIDANLGLGGSNPLAANGLAAVPEPSAMALLGVGALALRRRVKR